MANALWLIVYELDPARETEYLHWFHEVHVAEKLARPGYTWAAHYRALDGDGEPGATCAAMFGGVDSRVFYDPSPAQIKPRQTPETRAMMACRSNSRMLILSEEWAAGGDDAEIAPTIAARRIQLALFDANGNDEQLGAWLAQDYLPASGQGGVTRKFLASTGSPRHLLIHETPAAGPGAASVGGGAWNDWSAQVTGYLSFPLGMPFGATRLWPAGD